MISVQSGGVLNSNQQPGSGFTSTGYVQKENPQNRVFPEAKISTAIFTMVKDGSRNSKSRAFVSRVHSGRLIEADSPDDLKK